MLIKNTATGQIFEVTEGTLFPKEAYKIITKAEATLELESEQPAVEKSPASEKQKPRPVAKKTAKKKATK